MVAATPEKIGKVRRMQPKGAYKNDRQSQKQEGQFASFERCGGAPAGAFCSRALEMAWK